MWSWKHLDHCYVLKYSRRTISPSSLSGVISLWHVICFVPAHSRISWFNSDFSCMSFSNLRRLFVVLRYPICSMGVCYRTFGPPRCGPRNLQLLFLSFSLHERPHVSCSSHDPIFPSTSLGISHGRTPLLHLLPASPDVDFIAVAEDLHTLVISTTIQKCCQDGSSI